MEYQAMNNAANAYQGAVLGAIGQANKVEAPRTLASAASRIETLNERLAKSIDALSMICSQIGAMSALNQIGGNPNEAKAVPGGAIHRLNDSADEAHAKLSAIEGYVVSIQRALG
ncbi:hypothetical protein AYJ54_00650 [Bradyrhizobium centrolobii]|uniref:Uncharacterized protein n=2 Tax=Bradyrhizobium centrolobii TaxID=1505087 RepID=A0A176YHE8_9BRAD|nr:hypothetical protein AYJ54_00650 [Bradyrhizobium centrolobii]